MATTATQQAFNKIEINYSILKQEFFGIIRQQPKAMPNYKIMDQTIFLVIDENTSHHCKCVDIYPFKKRHLEEIYDKKIKFFSKELPTNLSYIIMHLEDWKQANESIATAHELCKLSLEEMQQELEKYQPNENLSLYIFKKLNY